MMKLIGIVRQKNAAGINLRMIRIALSVVFSVLTVAPLRATNNPGVGTASAQFLKLGVNARAIAMGEAYSAVAEGSDAIYWNPAGLGMVDGKSFSGMHAVYLSKIFYDYGSYAQSLSKFGTMGVSVQYLQSTLIDQTDEFGLDLGTFRLRDMALTLGYGKVIAEGNGHKVSLGVSGKFIQSKIIETANTEAVDLGLLWHAGDKLGFGFAAQNLGGKLRFVNKDEDLPFNLKIGSLYRPIPSLLTTMDVNFPRDNNPNIALGTEYQKEIAREMTLAGRLGFNSRTVGDISGFSAMSVGVGFGWKGYGVNFAWAPFGELGNSYRFSFTAKF